jgi:hypothetical protein
MGYYQKILYLCSSLMLLYKFYVDIYNVIGDNEILLTL